MRELELDELMPEARTKSGIVERSVQIVEGL
jgi:hypothetical protein